MLRRCTVALAFVLGACGTAGAVDTEDSVPPTAIPTVPGVGNLPDTIPTPALDESDDGVAEPPISVVVTRPVDEDGVVVETVAERVNGNRLLVIGDSILASTATRYGGELCEALNPIGWTVEVDAEPGRFVPFGNEVARARIDVGDEEDDFDAVVIHLGSNYGRDRDAYYEELSELLYRAAPRPTLLLTVTEYRPEWSEANEVIRELAGLYDNVTIVDWEKIARSPGVLSRDGLHPGSQGEAVLVEQIAVALGELNAGEGDCLSSSFTDDSAVRGNGGSTSGGTTSGGSSTGDSSTGGSSTGGSSSGGSSSGGSSSGGSSTSGGTSGSSTGGSATGGGSGGGSTGATGTTTGSTTGGSTGTTGATTTGTTGSTTGGSTGTTGSTTTGTTGGTAGDSTTGGSATGGSTGTTDGSTGSTGTTGGTTGGSTTGGSTGTTSGSTTGGSTGTTGGTTGSSAGSGTTGATTGGTTAGTTGGTTGGSTTAGETSATTTGG